MRILVCPLNWGLGHAARCVPLIRRLMEENHEVILASDGYPLAFLQQEFPTLRFIESTSYPIRYSGKKSQVGAMLRCLPGIIKRIYTEHKWLKNIIKTEHIDQVISDNRFGLWNNNIKSVYITHQLMVKMPKGLKFMEPVVWRIHRTFIKRYDECWIPDYEGVFNLSGDLSHKYKITSNAKFIGPLSRFGNIKNVGPDDSFEIICVLSGVEPQRSILEQELISRFRNSKKQVLIIRGLPQAKKETEQKENVTLFSHVSTEEMAAYFLGAEQIICRSGYSTIMDLEILGCLRKAEFIPTPGQTEQEYLADIHSDRNKY